MNLKLQKLLKMSMAFLMVLLSVWGWGQTITINLTSAGGSTNLGTNAYASGAERTWTQTGVSFGGKAITSAVSPNAGAIQAQANNGVIYNTTAIPGRIKTIQVVQNSSTAFTLSGGTSRLVNATTGNYTVTGGTSAGSVTGTTWTSADLSANNYTFFALKKGTNAGYITSIVITYESATTPSFSSTGTFANFSYVEGNGPSASQSVSVSGNNLDNTAVTVTAPANYEVSLTGGNDFADTKTISYSTGAFTSQNVYARLKSGLALGAYSGNITISGGGVATAATVAVDGNVVATPVVTASSFTGNVGVAFSENIQATQAPVSYALANGTTLPAGLNLNTTTGAITGTPTVAGTFTADVTATNTAGTSAAATITLTIAKGNQTVVLNNVTAVVNDPNTTLPATTAQGILINYSSSDASVASVSGNTLSFPGIGSATITAANIGDSNYNAYSATFTVTVTAVPVTPWEDFELGTKTGYAAGNVTSTAGSWNLDNALLGTSASDRKNGSQSVRIQNTGFLQTNFDITSGVGKVTVSHAKYGTDANNSWVLKASTDGGATWTAFTSSTINTTSTALTAEEITVNLGGNVRLRIEKTTSGGRLNIDDIYITSYSANTWNGSVWSDGTPVATQPVVINGPYTGAGFTAQSITVNANNTLTVNSGETFTTGNTTNNGNIIVNDGGNFIQTVGSTYTAGTGSSFITNRNSASAVNKYVFWSSPVVDQNIFTAYSSGSSALSPTYVMTYNTTSNFYDLVTNTDSNFVANSGKGYSVKVPQANAGVLFGGTNKTPNNGIVNVSLAGTPGGLNNFNLIGNPYPSNLDLTAFYNANTAGIESTLWFWDNTTGNVTTQTGSTATNVGYATINAASGTWAEAPGTQSYNSATLNGLGSIAKIGQGFIVRALDAGQISFTNAMRASTAGVTLNKNVDPNAGKFWIKLTTSYGNTVTQAVTYSQNALNAYDVYDSKAMGVGSDAFYSLAGAEKVIIQGRAPFSINDVVPLGAKHFENGNFTVSLSHKEGLFTNGQAIYLHDKSTGTYTNLQTQAYSFTANAGEFTDRFEIVYKLNVLATAEVEKDAFEVYRDGEDFFVRNNKNIENIEIFDAAGRKVQDFDSNSKLVRIKLDSRGVYIIKAKSAGKEYSKKVVK